jgi:NAD(P)-dependent dehydrogenase (short-subunit alcohol dehydrogenase family)
MDVMKVWLVTGASRGMGAEFARAALEVGHAVVATGRRPAEVTDALGESDRLLVTALDVTSVDESEAAIVAGVGRLAASTWWSIAPAHRSRATSRRCRLRKSNSNWR